MLNSTIVLATTVALLVIAALIIVVCLLKNMFRSVVRGGTSLLVALLCIPIAMLLAGAVSNGLVDTVLSFLDPAVLEQLTADIPSAQGAAQGAVRLLAAPLLFVVFYLLLRLILGLIAGAVARSVEKKNESLGYKNKAIGAAIGVVCGLVLTVVYMVPLVGYTSTVKAVVDTGLLNTAIEGSQILTEEDNVYIEKITNTPVLSVSRALGGRAIFNGLTTAELNGEKVSMGKEIPGLCEVAGAALPLLDKGIDQWGEAEVQLLQESLPEAFESSGLLRVLGAEALSGLSRAWLKGESFLAQNPPEATGTTKVILNSALLMFRDTTKDTIVDDIRGMAPVVSVALQLTQLESGGDMSTLLSDLANSADTPEVKSLLMTAGVGLLADNLGLYNNKEEIYNDYSAEMASLSGTELDNDAMIAEIKRINDKYAVQMSAEEVAALAEAIRTTPYPGANSSASLPTHGYPVLIAIDQPTGTAGANEWMQNLLGQLAQEHPDLGRINPEGDFSNLMTTEDLTALTSNKEAMSQVSKEAIVSLIESAASLINSGEGITMEKGMEFLGTAANALGESESGNQLLGNLVTGVLQSPKAQDALGITASQATQIATSLKNNDGLKDLEQTAKDLTNIINVVNHLKEGGSVESGKLSPEDFYTLISDTRDSSLALLRDLATPEMLLSFKLPAASVDGVSTLLNDLLTELANARKNWEGDRYQKEADALYRIMTLVVGLQNHSGATFEERHGISAKTLVDTLCDSELLAKVLPDTVAKLYADDADPFGISGKLQGADFQEILSEINAAKEGASASVTALLNAVLKMMGE